MTRWRVTLRAVAASILGLCVSLALIRVSLPLLQSNFEETPFAIGVGLGALGLFGIGFSVGGLVGHGLGDREETIALGFVIGVGAVALGMIILPFALTAD